MATIIIGATSGIGRELAVQLVRRGEVVGAVGRRRERLEALRSELGDRLHWRAADVTDVDRAGSSFDDLAAEMERVDRVVLCAGTGYVSAEPSWEQERQVIAVNVLGFTAMAHRAFDYFCKQGSGHIIGVSSVGSVRGNGTTRTYAASKAYINNYLEGLRINAAILDKAIAVTTILPGYVESEMTEQMGGMFWVAPTAEAVEQIIEALDERKREAYVTKRWKIIALITRALPHWWMTSPAAVRELRKVLALQPRE